MTPPILIFAQRVRSKDSRTQEVHVYDYELAEHPSDLLAPFAKDYKGRKLVHKHGSFEGGGNLVMSYLDVVTPDRATFCKMLQQFYAEMRLDDEMPPFQFAEGQLALSFAVYEASFLPTWRHELKELARHILVP